MPTPPTTAPIARALTGVRPPPCACAQLLGLYKRGTSRPAEVKWGWNRRVGKVAPPKEPPCETWDKGSGEVLGQGFVPSSDLLRAMYEGSVLCEQEWAVELLEAVCTLTQPDPTLWGCPLLRCLVVPPATLPTPTQGAGGKAESKKAKAAAAGVSLKTDLDEPSPTNLPDDAHSGPSSKVLGKRPVVPRGRSRSPRPTKGGAKGWSPHALAAPLETEPAGRGRASVAAAARAADPNAFTVTVHVYISRLLLYAPDRLAHSPPYLPWMTRQPPLPSPPHLPWMTRQPPLPSPPHLPRCHTLMLTCVFVSKIRLI